jgi:hypothetical protein
MAHMYICTSHQHYYSFVLSIHLPFFLAGWLSPTHRVGYTYTPLSTTQKLGEPWTISQYIRDETEILWRIWSHSCIPNKLGNLLNLLGHCVSSYKNFIADPRCIVDVFPLPVSSRLPTSTCSYSVSPHQFLFPSTVTTTYGSHPSQPQQFSVFPETPPGLIYNLF